MRRVYSGRQPGVGTLEDPPTRGVAPAPRTLLTPLVRALSTRRDTRLPPHCSGVASAKAGARHSRHASEDMPAMGVVASGSSAVRSEIARWQPRSTTRATPKAARPFYRTKFAPNASRTRHDRHLPNNARQIARSEAIFRVARPRRCAAKCAARRESAVRRCHASTATHRHARVPVVSDPASIILESDPYRTLAYT